MALLQRQAPEQARPLAEAFTRVDAVLRREQQRAEEEDLSTPPLPPDAIQLLEEARQAAVAEAAAEGGSSSGVISLAVGSASIAAAGLEFGVSASEGEGERPRKLLRTLNSSTSSIRELPLEQQALLQRVAGECERAQAVLGSQLQLSVKPEVDGRCVLVACKPTAAAAAASAAVCTAAGRGVLDPAWLHVSLRLGADYPQVPPTAVFLSGSKAPAGPAAELAHQCRMRFAEAAAALPGPPSVQAVASAWLDSVASVRTLLYAQ